MAEIVLDGISKRFPDGTMAVRDLDLEIDDGEFLILVGPSGSGKTTALRMVVGLEEVTGGTIKIGDRVVNDLPPRERNIAMVFQNYALYPHMSVFGNMSFGLKLRKVDLKDITERVDGASDMLGIKRFLKRKPSNLSGGQRQRVAMGRAIVRRPDAFLMDEPLSNLDAKLRVQTRTEIQKLHQELGTTTMYVTHDQTEAMTMADRVAVMRDGLLQQVASPQGLYRNPVNLFVGAFIGSPAMNLAVAHLSAEDGAVYASFGSHRLVLPDGLLNRRKSLRDYLERDVILGIRPENLEDASLVSQPGPGRFIDVKVGIAEPLGAEMIVHFEVDAQPVRTKDTDELERDVEGEPVRRDHTVAEGEHATFTARLLPKTEARDGTSLRLAVDVDELYLFDADSGDTIT
jgi:multiple sugar transport system ATP-binding protein